MTRIARIALSHLLVAAAGLAVLASTARTRAHANARTALAALDSATRDTAEVIRLRAHASSHLLDRPPSAGLAKRAAYSVASAALPSSMLVGVSPESESVVTILPPVKRRRATLSFSHLTLPQFGRLLSEWRAREPGWTTTGIDIVPLEGVSPTPGADRPLRVVLTIEAVYFDSPIGASP